MQEAPATLKAGAPHTPEARTLMGRLLAATGGIVHGELSTAIDSGDPVRVATAAHLARRWFTNYRVLKWRWLEQHIAELPAYQFFEA